MKTGKSGFAFFAISCGEFSRNGSCGIWKASLIMKTPRKNAEPAPAGVSDLRQRAEEKAARLPEHPGPVSPEEAQQQLHELQVHQIELELQNEELRRAQAALEESCARYLDLYDFAPVGYATLNEKGVFLEANLAAAALLGVPRNALVGQMLFRFIHKEDQDNYFQCRRQLFKADTPHGCDLRMRKPDGAIFWAHLAATAAQDANGAPVHHVVFSDITEKRAAEEALRLAGEERHRVILQTAMDGVWMSDMEGRLLEVNASYCRMSGYREQELLAMRISDLEVMETHHTAVHDIRKIMAQGEDRFESLHRRKDGRIIAVDVSVQYRPDDGGRMVTFLHDITARKQAQKMLQMSEAALAKAQQIGHMGSWVLDDATHELWWSDETFRIFGYASGAVRPTKELFFKSVHPEDRAFLQEAIAVAWARRSALGVDYRIILPDGEERVIHEQAHVIYDVAGHPEKWMGLVQDITEQRRVENALAMERNKLAAAFENTAMGLVLCDGQGADVAMNAAALRFHGFASAEEMPRLIEKNTDVWELRHPDGRLMSYDEWPLVRATRGDFAHDLEVHYRNCKHGKEWVWSLTCTPVRNSAGDVTFIVETLLDVTARKHLEVEAQRYQQRLRDLAEWQAVADDEERWRISRRIHDTIVQNLSLASMRLGLIATPVDGAGMKEAAGPVLKVRALLDGAIEECRTVMSDLTPPMLYELGLVSALHELAGQMEVKHGVRMVVEDDGQEDVMSHPQRGLMFESIRELVMNAMKHAAPSKIRVSASRGDQDMVISVQDNGKGFYAGSGMHTMPNYHGGFGLFSIRQRLKGLGGRLEIVSAPGDGSTVTISLPMRAGGGG
jgi:PAS domain S-box-containing protein